MSKSKQHSNRATQALRRQRRSLPKKVLDIERHFIDDLMTRKQPNPNPQHTNGALPILRHAGNGGL